METAFLDQLKFDANGLIPAVIVDDSTGEVLMVAYMNRDSLRATVETKLTNFWSRSRKAYWVKGETSGHTQEVKEIRTDCDRDTLVLRVKQNGAACHEGYYSCFFRKLGADGSEVTDGRKVFDPQTVYKKG